MSQDIKLFVYPVKDLARARAFYGKLLGAEPYADSPYYCGFRVGGQEIGLDPNGHQGGLAGPIGYWYVADVKKRVGELLEAGATVAQEPRDVGGGRLMARLKDADGNLIGLVQTE